MLLVVHTSFDHNRFSGVLVRHPQILTSTDLFPATLFHLKKQLFGVPYIAHCGVLWMQFISIGSGNPNITYAGLCLLHYGLMISMSSSLGVEILATHVRFDICTWRDVLLMFSLFCQSSRLLVVGNMFCMAFLLKAKTTE